jgi:hypothetical protein
MYSMRVAECRSTWHSTHSSGFTVVARRYVMSSKAPSGGMKLMVRSFSNRARRTHWWHLMSDCAATDLNSKATKQLGLGFNKTNQQFFAFNCFQFSKTV